MAFQFHFDQPSDPHAPEERGEYALSSAEKEQLTQAHAQVQNILMAQYVKKNLPLKLVDAYDKVKNQADSPEVLAERGRLEKLLSEESDRLCVRWTFGVEHDFAMIVGRFNAIACNRPVEPASLPEEQIQAVQFARGFIELAKAGKLVRSPVGYTIELSKEHAELAQQLQDVLDEVERVRKLEALRLKH
jgi:hypothetical protein